MPQRDEFCARADRLGISPGARQGCLACADCAPLAALLGAACVALAFWPGYMSWDSACQWCHASNDQFESTHAPLLAMIWQLTGWLLPGPGGLLQLGLLLLVTGLWPATAGPAGAPVERPLDPHRLCRRCRGNGS